jgi:rhodanese-related sulfurtransferase
MIVAAAFTLGMMYTAATGNGLFRASPASTSPAMPADVGATFLTLEEAEGLFRLQSGLFIDSRHPDDFIAGHIRGAINVPLHDFDESHPILSILAPDQMLIIYCDGEDCNSSVELAKLLRASGFSNVKVFFGGWKQWRAHMQPTDP